jgi:hypothetical protein
MEQEEGDEEDTASIPISSCGCWLSCGEERILVPTSAEETHTFSNSSGGSGNAEPGGRAGKTGTTNSTENSTAEK